MTACNSLDSSAPAQVVSVIVTFGPAGAVVGGGALAPGAVVGAGAAGVVVAGLQEARATLAAITILSTERVLPFMAFLLLPSENR
jgi:hypothetical protein